MYFVFVSSGRLL